MNCGECFALSYNLAVLLCTSHVDFWFYYRQAVSAVPNTISKDISQGVGTLALERVFQVVAD